MATTQAPTPPAALGKPGPRGFTEALDLLKQLLPATEIAAADRTALQRAFADHPSLWRVVGDMALQVGLFMIEKYAAQPVVQEAINAGVLALNREMGRGRAPTQKARDRSEDYLLDQ